MLSTQALSFSLVWLASLVAGQTCTLQFDGRVPATFTPATFDTNNNVFNPDNVFGADLAFSKIIQLPGGTASLFDTNTVPAEVTISDASIFNGQTGFRRAELLPASNSGTDPSTQGVKTLHFSLKQDATRPLNFSHEYQLAFLESQDFSTNQVVLKTGTILGQNTANPETLQVIGNVNEGANVLFSTPFDADVFHNFAFTLDFNQLTTQVFYSQNDAALVAQTQAIANDVSGQGQFHFGVLKKGIGGTGDITKSGFQESGINEGIVFGGIFEEDSSTGCVSLQP